MEIISENSLGNELKRWFSKSIYPCEHIQFDHNKIYKITLETFLFDYKRYFPEENFITLEKLLGRHELIGILLYRISRNYFLLGKENISSSFSLLGTFLSGFEIYYSADIGRGLRINHGLGTVIGARTVIGENLLLHQGVTFGDRHGGRPILKDNITVYAGAKILGNIKIGSQSIIAANSVCIIDVPDNTVVAGIPAKIVSKRV